MVDQRYRSSERGNQHVLIATNFVRFFFFQHDLVAQFGSEQDWSAS